MDRHGDLLSDPLAEQLEHACRTTVGDTLRSVTYYVPDAYEQVYLRSDLEADADLSGFVSQESDGFRTAETYRNTELGEYGYTLRVFENGFVTRVTTETHGAFVTTDSITIRRADDVAAALRSVLAEHE